MCLGLLMVAASVAGWVAMGLGAETRSGSSGFGSGTDGMEKTDGTVVSTTPQSVDLKLTGGQITLHAAKSANKSTKEVLSIIGQLAPQDSVTITWTQKDGRKLIQKIEGRGTLDGVVTARTDAWVNVKPENGAPQKLLFPWAGRTPQEVATLDQKLLKKIARARVGDKARLTWEISDAKRVVDVRYLSKTPAEKSPSHAASPKKKPSHPGASPRRLLNQVKRLNRH